MTSRPFVLAFVELICNLQVASDTSVKVSFLESIFTADDSRLGVDRGI